MYTRSPNSVNPALIHCGKIQHFIVQNQYSWICQTSTPVRWQSIFCFNRKIVYRPSTSYTTKVAPETNYLMMILVWQSRAIWRAVKLSKLQRGVHYLWCKRDRLNSTTWPINNPEQSSVEHQGWSRFSKNARSRFNQIFTTLLSICDISKCCWAQFGKFHQFNVATHNTRSKQTIHSITARSRAAGQRWKLPQTHQYQSPGRMNVFDLIVHSSRRCRPMSSLQLKNLRFCRVSVALHCENATL